ncbi:hypothetical protein [Kitasatospora sp. CB01950]|uniref:hypothetical protein n=1 Tax=Kitasatospora sp. CB01950 TaxID=1703930 RepID=UPI00093C4D03|nr:hypothetical protein [Kitasatospora sp. CB01950]OKJ15653.1 hypothetical protein AMK19_05040 [Kitasatospora sp. CB01950]
MTTSATEPPSPEPSAAGRPDTPKAHVPRQPRDRAGRNAQPDLAPQDSRLPAPRTRRQAAAKGKVDAKAGAEAAKDPAPSRPARRESEPLAPVPPEQLGSGLYPFLDRQHTLLRDIARDTGDTFRFVLIVVVLVLAVAGAAFGVGYLLHNMPLASAAGTGTLLLTGWGVARSARANRRRREQAGAAPQQRQQPQRRSNARSRKGR